MDATTITTQASDGVTVYGERYYGNLDSTTPLILLFHQGGSNGRAEYKPLADWLNDAGYRAIAWDQRTGGDIYGEANRTANGLPDGERPSYCDAYPDLQAALDYVLSGGEAETAIVWGSSYSAALVFRLAAENVGNVSGVLAFSPASGGPMERCRARIWANDVKAPVAVYKPSSEMERPSAPEQRRLLQAAGVEFSVVANGVHGSSMLVDERTEHDMNATRANVITWLDRFTPEGHEAIPAPMMTAWQTAWNKTVTELIDGLVAKFESEDTPNVPHQKKAALIDDMKTLFHEEVGWDAMGRGTTKQLLRRICGIDVLKSVSSSMTGSPPFDELPESIQNSYQSCATDVQLHVAAAPAYAMMEVARDRMPLLYMKHGIAPQDM